MKIDSDTRLFTYTDELKHARIGWGLSESEQKKKVSKVIKKYKAHLTAIKALYDFAPTGIPKIERKIRIERQ